MRYLTLDGNRTHNFSINGIDAYGELILSTMRASPSFPYLLEIMARFSSLCTHPVYIHKCVGFFLMNHVLIMIIADIRTEYCNAIAMHLALFNLKKAYLLLSLQRYPVLNIPMAFLYSQQFIFCLLFVF